MTPYRFERVYEALRVTGAPEGRVLTCDRPCEGSKYHSPTPLLATVHQLGDEEIVLCPACTENLRTALLLRSAQHDKALSWPTLLEFGNTIRALYKRCLELGVEEI